MSQVLEPRSAKEMIASEWEDANRGETHLANESPGSWYATPKKYEVGLSGSTLRIKSGQGLSSNCQKAIQAILNLSGLRENWNSYGASAIKNQSLIAAIQLVINIMLENTPVPQVVPTTRGTIQLEWHCAGVDLEIEVLSTNKFHMYAEADDENEEIDESVSYDLTRMVSMIRRLS